MQRVEAGSDDNKAIKKIAYTIDPFNINPYYYANIKLLAVVCNDEIRYEANKEYTFTLDDEIHHITFTCAVTFYPHQYIDVTKINEASDFQKEILTTLLDKEHCKNSKTIVPTNNFLILDDDLDKSAAIIQVTLSNELLMRNKKNNAGPVFDVIGQLKSSGAFGGIYNSSHSITLLNNGSDIEFNDKTISKISKHGTAHRHRLRVIKFQTTTVNSLLSEPLPPFSKAAITNPASVPPTTTAQREVYYSRRCAPELRMKELIVAKAADVEIIVMAHVQGKNLLDIILDDELGDLQDRLKLCFAISKKIQNLADQGILHRDLKPENIMARRVNGEWVVTIIDFAFACQVTDKSTAGCGSPLYAAPEVAMRRVSDCPADVYSFGVICALILGYGFDTTWNEFTMYEHFNCPLPYQGSFAIQQMRKPVQSTITSLLSEMRDNDPLKRIKIGEVVTSLQKMLTIISSDKAPNLSGFFSCSAAAAAAPAVTIGSSSSLVTESSFSSLGTRLNA